MTVKKIGNASFHLGNKLNGSKATAKYGIFDGGLQVGYLLFSGMTWTAYNMSNKPDFAGFSFGSLSQAKRFLSANAKTLS